MGEDAENPSVWPEAEADRWYDEDLDEWAEDLEWCHRWVEINGERASGLLVPGREPQVVLVGDDHLGVVESIAEFGWSSEDPGRPVSFDGGSSLGRLGDGLLYRRRWGDLGAEHHVVPVDEDPASVARALADWVEWAEVEQALALSEEPVDPDGTVSAETRETIARQLALCETGLVFPRGPVGRLAREQVAAGSESYRRTRDALARPDGEDGRALRAMLEAVDEGDEVPDSVTWAMWQ